MLVLSDFGLRYLQLISVTSKLLISININITEEQNWIVMTKISPLSAPTFRVDCISPSM